MATKHANTPDNISDLMEKLARTRRDMLSVDDVLSTFGNRATAPLIALFGIILMTPIAAIPGSPIIFSGIIMLLAGQSLFTNQFWVPQFIRKREAKGDKVREGLKKAIPYVQKVERLMKVRLTSMTGTPWDHIATVYILLLALMTYPTGFIPGALIPPGASIAILAMAKFHQDGLLMSIGLTVGTVALGLGIYLMVQ